MSKLRFSISAVKKMALFLAAHVEPRQIALSFHCHFTTVYRIKQNVTLIEETRSAPVSVMIERPRKITAVALEA